MLQKGLRQIPLTIAIAISLSLLQPCFAHISAEQMQTEITKSKILPADSKVTAAINGAELTLSVYKHEQATENDCKIDAVLLAKAAFSADSDLSRANILFYDPRVPDAYDEVAVTVMDVAAYASGQVSQQKLLSALKVTRISSTGQSIHAPVETAPKAGESQKASPTSYTYSSYGVTLNYPVTWRVDYPRGGNTAVRFLLPTSSSSPATVDMQVYSTGDTTPAEIAASDPRDTLVDSYAVAWTESFPEMMKPYAGQMMAGEMAKRKERERIAVSQGKYVEYKQWLAHEHNQYTLLSKVAVPATASFGKGKSVPCSQSSYWLVSTMSAMSGGGEHHHHHMGFGGSVAPHFIRMVSFKQMNQVILLALFCGKADAGSANAQFEQLLANIECAKAAPAAKKK